MSEVWVFFLIIWAVAEFIAAKRGKDFRGRMKIGAIWAVVLTTFSLVGQMSPEKSAIVQFLITSVILGFVALVLFYIRVFIAGIWSRHIGRVFESLKTNIKSESAAREKNEEELYAVVAQEMADGERRPGLWLKALEKAEGNEVKQVSEYIKLRVKHLKDEMEARSHDTPSDKDATTKSKNALSDENEKKEKDEKWEELKRNKIEKIIQEEKWSELEAEHFKPLNSAKQSHHLKGFIRRYEHEKFPLHKAVYDGNIELVKVLILFGFDVSLLSPEGRSIRDAAAGNKKMIEVVENTTKRDLVDQNFMPSSFIK